MRYTFGSQGHCTRLCTRSDLTSGPSPHVDAGALESVYTSIKNNELRESHHMSALIFEPHASHASQFRHTAGLSIDSCSNHITGNQERYRSPLFITGQRNNRLMRVRWTPCLDGTFRSGTWAIKSNPRRLAHVWGPDRTWLSQP